jgi:hypothetical protein
MKARSRKLAVQLTPLLDLLLIVLFAQLLDVRGHEAESRQLAGEAVADREQMTDELAELNEAHSRSLRELEALRERNQALEESAAESAHDAEETDARLDEALARQRVLGELVAELFQIPPEDLEDLLNEGRVPPIAESPEELARMRERFREMSEQRSGEVILHLLSYEEIRKRCDVWSLHVDGQGIAELDTGDQTFRVRVNAADFADELFRLYKTIPQPKSLVIVLLTYDRDSRKVVTDTVVDAMPGLLDRMREDSGGRARFEYANLGIRVE